ncbi:MAG: hypothetical protein KBD82_19010 [Rhodoferax sp.]|jgi:hypothetical protein|uniref:hypothetical protein n=1 Tax=Rhodoferax sp. TaxID=50421 RepID=UPI001B64A8C7|nr:hypothetical protein [Rhodoferax sp.]MBP9737724.1 hypothetical protein [Rhodoferax sp.]
MRAERRLHPVSHKPNTLALPQRAHGTGGCGQDEQIKRLPDRHLGNRCDMSLTANGVTWVKGLHDPLGHTGAALD